MHGFQIFNLSDVIRAAKIRFCYFSWKDHSLFLSSNLHFPIPNHLTLLFNHKLNKLFSFIYYCSNVVVMDMWGPHLDGRQVSGLQDGEHLSSVHREGTETLTPVANYRFSFLLLLRVHKFCLQVYICSLHSFLPI